ncbi:MAG: YDG domain-containing protein, partial [Fibromonadales bacterium]|nr:YDG domain-containing protein [Fibromonadales bacterium]
TASNGGGTLLSGQTSSSLSVPISEGGVFYRYVVVTNTQGGRTATTSSNLSTITVNPPLPTIGTQPANRTLALGEPCNLSVTATLPATGGVLIYQWYSNASASASGGTTIGTNSSSYSAPTSKIGENYYYVIVTNTQGGRTATITSNAVKVTVNPTITTQPTNKSVLSGAMAEFTVGTELNGASSLTYNWQVSTNNGSSFSDVYNGTGYTTTSYTTPAATLAMNGYRYRCIVTNNFGGIDTSGVATLTVTAPPAITTQSVNNSVNYGETAGFTIAAALNGASSLTYQWQVSSDGTIFSNVSNGTGGTSASYTTPAATMAINGYLYRCIVSSIYGSDTSNIATLTVNVIPPSITTQPANKTIPYSETAIFAVEAAANGASLLTYQWQRSTKGGLSYSNVSDGIGGTSASYETPAATVKMSGYRYRCIVTNNLAQSDTSYVATLNVNKAVLTWNTDGAASNKVYDGTTIATVNTEPTLIGVISGDDVIPAAGMVNFSDANAGIAKVVTAIDYGITGTDIDNYLAPTEQPVFAKANITALQLAWNTDGAVSNKTYDGTTIATVSTEPSLVGVISYDDVTPVVGTVNFSDAHVGIGKTVIATGYDITGANASNYIVPDSQPVFAKADIMSPQDDIDIALAKATIEDTDFSSVAQSSLNTKGMANGFVADIIAELELNGVEAVVTAVNFQAAVAGTVANESGTNGSYTFTVTLSKGIGIPQTTTTLTLAIVATSYGNTPIHFPQLVTSNHAIQIPNGINLQVASNTIVEIFNLKGNLISRQNFGSGVYTLSLGHLPKGIYIVLVGKQTLRVPVR